ncbi:hypothetical protein [Luteolibacter sp. Populi]|uniref:hypothetical protein n=1 Tax=Luteolibacter sp. Populi TaxID=3230487 RepID=UPI003465B73F
MALPNNFRSLIYLVVGLAVGGAGAVLFKDSLPGPEGSPEERADKAEAALRKAENRILALEGPGRTKRGGRTLADGIHDIKDDLAAGRAISPDDIFRAAQPLMRDLSPIFDRMRVRQEKRNMDRMTGELTRKYDLTEGQQAELKKFFDKKVEDEAKRFSDLISRDGTTMEDMARATQDTRWDDGLDSFMAGTLKGDKLATFQDDRITEKSQRVQQEADMRVTRVDSIVNLDPAQRDQVFGIMARNSRDYDPAMELEGGAGEIGAAPAGDRNQAMMSVLRPEQRQQWEAEKQRRRDEAQREMAEMGFAMPSSWDVLDDY